MVNPIRHVDANVLAKYSLERFGYAIAIVRMQNGQPFRECRNAFRWIETEENERLRRPIIESSIRPQRPASTSTSRSPSRKENSPRSLSVRGTFVLSDLVRMASRLTVPALLLGR